MHAAVVREFGQPPRYEEFPTPHGDVLVEVIAAGLHPRVRSGASGSHYTSAGRLPMVPGIDGVGRLPDGRTVYFVAPDDVPGSMAERAVVDVRRTVELPAGADPAAEVDVVLDYLWGPPAAAAMMALLTARVDRSRELNWIQIGAVAGPTIELPSVALRSANLRLQGNGQGAVSTRAYLAELPALIDEIGAGTIEVTARTEKLADVEAAWTVPDVPGVRTVLVP